VPASFIGSRYYNPVDLPLAARNSKSLGNQNTALRETAMSAAQFSTGKATRSWPGARRASFEMFEAIGSEHSSAITVPAKRCPAAAQLGWQTFIFIIRSAARLVASSFACVELITSEFKTRQVPFSQAHTFQGISCP
jgi:hypothetical protein